MGVANATAFGENLCGIPVGHTVWFEATAQISGRLTFSTCHPSTTYDTVVQAYQGGDSGCEFMSVVECIDDTVAPQCLFCGGYRGSTVSFDCVAGVRYRFAVGSFDNNSAGCNLCLGVVLTICEGDNPTPPVAEITAPTPMTCACSPINVFGSAYDLAGALDHWTLEYMPTTGGSWTQFAAGTWWVDNGFLGTWTPTGLPQGYYFIRLTSENVCGKSASAVTMVWLNTVFDTLDFRAPTEGAILGGSVCLDGTVWDNWCTGSYTADFRPTGGAWSPVNPSSPTYYTWMINDPFASWNTMPMADGNYQLRVIGTTACGYASTVTRNVVVDNTSPTAMITSPLSCAFVSGTVLVYGTANDAHMAGWTLQYTGGPAHGWVTISSGTSPVINSLLGTWNAAGLPACAYTLRLIVTDTAVRDCNGALHNQSEYTVSVKAGMLCPVDLNGDSDEDLQDYAAFQNCFTGP
jgi:hypothetical protein